MLEIGSCEAHGAQTHQSSTCSSPCTRCSRSRRLASALQPGSPSAVHNMVAPARTGSTAPAELLRHPQPAQPQPGQGGALPGHPQAPRPEESGAAAPGENHQARALHSSHKLACSGCRRPHLPEGLWYFTARVGGRATHQLWTRADSSPSRGAPTIVAVSSCLNHLRVEAPAFSSTSTAGTHTGQACAGEALLFWLPLLAISAGVHSSRVRQIVQG